MHAHNLDPQAIRNLEQRVETCLQQAERHFARSFARPAIGFRLRGSKAGVAHLQENRLRFNPQLYRENLAHFLQHTVAHEVAHLIAHQLHGSRIRPHGPEWQAIMEQVLGVPAERCHSYRIEPRERSVHLYTCNCPDTEHPLSSLRHARVAQGFRYQCRRCRGLLKDTGRQARRRL